jgi:transcriptional regulator with XRE-family HTH domain
MQAEHVTWRDFLRQLDERQKQRLVQALGIQRKTLRRWITGDTSTPHLQALQHIAEALPSHLRWRFILLLHQDSALSQATLRSLLPGLPPVLPASLYARVLQAQATNPHASLLRHHL